MIVSSSSAAPGTSSSRAVGCCAGALAAIFAAVFGVTATGSYAGVIGPGIGDAALTAWMSNTAQVRQEISQRLVAQDVLTSFPLTTLQICQAVLGPTVSLSADLWGRKPFMMAGLGLGAIGAIVTATSHHAYVALLGESIFRAHIDSGCPALHRCCQAISSSRRELAALRLSEKVPLTW